MTRWPTGPFRPPQAIITARPILPAAPPPPRTVAPPRLDLSFLSRSAAGLDLALALLVLLAIPLGAQFAVLGGADESQPTAADTSFLILAKWFDALLVVVVTTYLVHRHRIPPASFGLQLDRLGRQIAWSIPTVAGIYAAMIPTVIVISALVMLMPQTQADLAHRIKFMELMPVNDLGSSILLITPVAIHEEFLFRGLLIPYLRRLTGGWATAILISTAIFAALHVSQGWLGVLQIFPIGIVLGLFFVLSRSLTAVMLAHFVFDLAQLQLVRFVLPWVERMAQQN